MKRIQCRASNNNNKNLESKNCETKDKNSYIRGKSKTGTNLQESYSLAGSTGVPHMEKGNKLMKSLQEKMLNLQPKRR